MDRDAFSDQAGLEAELRRSRRREKMLSGTELGASIGRCEWDCRDDRIVACSDGYAHIFRLSVEDLLADRGNRSSLLQLVHPDDREACERFWELLKITGSQEIEYRVILPDGQLIYLYESGIRAAEGAEDGELAVSLIQDLTERRLHEKDLENREALAQQVEAISDIGHYIFNLRSETYIYISQGFASIHGVSVDEYLSMVNSREDDIDDVHAEDYDRLAEAYRRHKEFGESLNVEYRIYRADGEIRWIREKSVVLDSVHGEAVQSTGVIQDITEQMVSENKLREARDSLETMVRSRTRKLAATVRQLEAEIGERKKIAAELDFLANHDALTGLPSLRLCKDRLDHSLADARRKRQMSAVMFLDLDGFKQINDAHGHELGDLVLKTVANRILAEIRETDTVARIGGDEFVIILSSLPDIAVAERIAGKLVDRVALAIQIEKIRVAVSASVGVSIYPRDGETAESLIRVADHVMYRVKREGKNGYGFAEAGESNIR